MVDNNLSLRKSKTNSDTMRANIFYVEDDETLSFVTKDNLELQGFKITHCSDGKSALQLIKNDLSEMDLCILDVMLPEVDGFELARKIRQIPILFLTAKSLKEDRINGLKIGADDYITKPFSIEELILKIEVFLKRSRIHSNHTASLFDIGKYSFDYKNLQLTLADHSKTLTQKEADLLKLFVENKNEVLKRSHILETVWGEDDYFLGRSLDVFISRLRKYLSEDDTLILKNIHGVGFKLNIS